MLFGYSVLSDSERSLQLSPLMVWWVEESYATTSFDLSLRFTLVSLLIMISSWGYRIHWQYVWWSKFIRSTLLDWQRLCFWFSILLGSDFHLCLVLPESIKFFFLQQQLIFGLDGFRVRSYFACTYYGTFKVGIDIVSSNDDVGLRYQADWCKVHSLLCGYIVRSTVSSCIQDCANLFMFVLRRVHRTSDGKPLYALLAQTHSRYLAELKWFLCCSPPTVRRQERSSYLCFLLRMVLGFIATS